MTKEKFGSDEVNVPPQNTPVNASRRKFFSYAALSATIVAAASCQKNTLTPEASDLLGQRKGTLADGEVDLGSGDVGILNYAYALEQLEAAFYVKVMQKPYATITEGERIVLSAIRDHEVAHREFFKKAIPSDVVIGPLEVNFSSIDFTSRSSVLMTAKAFEDLGVTAYNGAGKLIADKGYLLLAGKIVSVEARHAAVIRDLVSYGSFADSTALDINGLDGARTPAEVLAIAGNYIKTKISYKNLPTS